MFFQGIQFTITTDCSRIRTFIPFLTIAKNNGDESLLLSTLERVKEYDLYNDIEIFCYILDTCIFLYFFFLLNRYQQGRYSNVL